jgi:hypothetical protein
MFELEARRGNAAAMNELGYLYLRGHGVAQNYMRAYMCSALPSALRRMKCFGTTPSTTSSLPK